MKDRNTKKYFAVIILVIVNLTLLLASFKDWAILQKIAFYCFMGFTILGSFYIYLFYKAFTSKTSRWLNLTFGLGGLLLIFTAGISFGWLMNFSETNQTGAGYNFVNHLSTACSLLSGLLVIDYLIVKLFILKAQKIASLPV